jgi:hypothetical protein
LSFQQYGCMSRRMSDFRRFRSFRSVLPFHWFGLNILHLWTPNGHQIRQPNFDLQFIRWDAVLETFPITGRRFLLSPSDDL